MHYDRITDAEKDKNWWLEEYKNRDHTKFQYTQEIERWSKFLRKLKGLAPIAAGVLFLLSLFFS